MSDNPQPAVGAVSPASVVVAPQAQPAVGAASPASVVAPPQGAPVTPPAPTAPAGAPPAAPAAVVATPSPEEHTPEQKAWMNKGIGVGKAIYEERLTDREAKLAAATKASDEASVKVAELTGINEKLQKTLDEVNAKYKVVFDRDKATFDARVAKLPDDLKPLVKRAQESGDLSWYASDLENAEKLAARGTASPGTPPAPAASGPALLGGLSADAVNALRKAKADGNDILYSQLHSQALASGRITPVDLAKAIAG